jgi:hypothetical protein
LAWAAGVDEVPVGLQLARELARGDLEVAEAAHDSHHRPQVGLPAAPEELGELRLLVSHNPLTPAESRFA